MDAAVTPKLWRCDLVDPTDKTLPGVEVRAVDLDHALAEARKYCRRFTLPGWRIKIDGVCYPAVLFKEDRGDPGRPRQRKRLKWR